MKPFKAVIKKFDRQLGMHYCDVPVSIGKKLDSEPRRLRAKINQSWQQCALMKSSEGDYYIYLQFDLRKKEKVQLGDEITVFLEKDDSEFGFDMPEELEIVLDQDSDGKEKFLRLLPGVQRNIIYYIMTGKREETRIQRSLFMIERVRSNEFKYRKEP